MQSHTDEYNQSSTSNVGHTAQSRVVYPICIKTIINVISVSHGNSGLHSMEDFLSLLTNADTTASDTTPSFADFFSLILTHQWYADEACYWDGYAHYGSFNVHNSNDCVFIIPAFQMRDIFTCGTFFRQICCQSL